MKTFFYFFFLSCSITVYAQVIPPGNIVEWEKAGCQYSFTEPQLIANVMSFGAVADGITDDRQSVVNAIASLNGHCGIVYFPSGTYMLQSGISLPDSVIIRGAGSNSSFIKINSTGSCFGIYGLYTGIFTDIVSGFEKDSKKITVANASLFLAGDNIEIRQDNGSWDTTPATWALKVIGQISKIIFINGDTLFLEDKLRLNFDTALNLEIQKIIPKQQIRIECLNIERTNTSTTANGNNIEISYAVNCRIKNIESNKSQGSHCMIYYSSHIEISSSYFHDAYMYDGSGSKGYGICLNNHSGLCLISDNIFKHLRHSMMVKTGANGNVFAYNYSRDPYRNGSMEYPTNYCGDISLHGHYPFANLFEGNIIQTIYIDQTWGPSGPNNTFFRNRAELYGIIMTSSLTNNQSFVGNEISGTGYNFPFSYGAFTISGSGHFQFGNNKNGSIIPTGTSTLNDSSYYLSAPPLFWNFPANWPSIGISNTINTGSIPAKNRYLSGIFTPSCIEEVCIPPTLQATAFVYSNINTTSVNLGWIRGNGNAILIIAKQGNAVNAEPVNGINYFADSLFGAGTQLGTANYVVYNGNSTSFNIIGLIPETTYYFTIYEYNSTTHCYKIPGITVLCKTSALNSKFYATFSNDWENEINWDHGIPGTNTNASIAATKLVVVNSNNQRCNNLIIEPLAKLTINTSKDLTVNGLLTLKSDTTGTASLIDNGLIYTAVNNVECFIAHTFIDEFHMLSSPVDSQSIGSLINQTDVIYLWNEATSNWIEYTDTSNFAVVNAGLNYVPVRGYAVSYIDTVTKIFSGNLNTGNMDIPLTVSSTAYSGWNFIANPYPSAINWNTSSGFNRSMLESSGNGECAFWLWNPLTGNYGSYISNGISGTNAVSNFIASSQGFWVKAAIAGIFSVNNTAREHASQLWLKTAIAENNSIRLKVTTSENTFSDELIINFGNQNNEGGAEKMFSLYQKAPNFYSSKLNKKWSINNLSSVFMDASIPLGFKAGIDGNYFISAVYDKSIGSILLEDLKTGISQNLSLDSNYLFYGQTNDNQDRFLLHLSYCVNTETNAEIPFVNYSKQKFNVFNPWGDKTTLSIYNINGRLIHFCEINKGYFNFTHNLSKAVYIVKIMNEQNVYIKKVVVY
ncbi:MAG: glycosyl hydrolase family 28-related protein [Bacteroidales bacterium]